MAATPADGIPLRMLRPHLRDLPAVAFPPGYGCRALRPDEGPAWTAIQRDAEPYLTIGDELFAREFGGDPAAIPQRCFFIVDPADAPVGTVSAWYCRDARGQDWGRLHWLAVRPAYRRQGLARAGVAHALRQLARWHNCACLHTASRRLAAIKLYLELGFVPDCEYPDAAAGWATVRAALDHPAVGTAR